MRYIYLKEKFEEKYNLQCNNIQLKQWDDGSYMSALGGAISLYLGISLAMVFEVLELIVDFFISCQQQ